MQLGRHAHRVLAEPSTRNDPTLRESLGGKARAAFGPCVRKVRQAQINVPDYEEHNLADPLDFLREDRNIPFVPEGALGDPQMPVALFGRLAGHLVRCVTGSLAALPDLQPATFQIGMHWGSPDRP